MQHGRCCFRIRAQKSASGPALARYFEESVLRAHSREAILRFATKKESSRMFFAERGEYSWAPFLRRRRKEDFHVPFCVFFHHCALSVSLDHILGKIQRVVERTSKIFQLRGDPPGGRLRDQRPLGALPGGPCGGPHIAVGSGLRQRRPHLLTFRSPGSY